MSFAAIRNVVNAEVKAGQRAGAKPGQFAARRRVRSAASAPAEMARISQPGRTRQEAMVNRRFLDRQLQWPRRRAAGHAAALPSIA
jgi:hypothetical protein